MTRVATALRIFTAPSATAKEAWLHWLQRYSPTDLVALTRGTIALLQADAASKRGFASLRCLLLAVHGVFETDDGDGSHVRRVYTPSVHSARPDGMAHNHSRHTEAVQSAGSLGVAGGMVGDEVEAATAAAAAAAAVALRNAVAEEAIGTASLLLSLSVALRLAATRIELRPRELAGWSVLFQVLSWVASSASSHGSSDRIELADALSWWEGASCWWLEACFEVERAPLVVAGAEAPLWIRRQACARRLLLMCDLCRWMTVGARCAMRAQLRPLDCMRS